jgi:predicted DNA binding CopG/RHH family protein
MREMLENTKNLNLNDDDHWTTQAIDEDEQETLVKSWRNYWGKKERQIENKLTEETI